jgi:putative N6-adenine-specific DNA methylase
VRVSDVATLRDLYARFGQVIRERHANWRVVIYSSDARLAREIGVPHRELFRTTNGGIKVAALELNASKPSLEPR